MNNVRKYVFVESSNFESNNYISLRIFHEQQTFHLKTTINHANERDWLFEIQSFVLSVQFSNKNQFYANFFQHLCISFESEHRLTHTNLRILHQSKNNVIAICYIILTILQSMVGFNQPSTTQWTKTLGNDLYLSKVPILSQIIIFLCVFFMNNKLFISKPP